MLHTKYQSSQPCGFRKHDFSCFPISACVKHVIPGMGPFLVPGILFLINLEEVYYLMLHTKYLGSKPGGFRQEEF